MAKGWNVDTADFYGDGDQGAFPWLCNSISNSNIYNNNASSHLRSELPHNNVISADCPSLNSLVKPSSSHPEFYNNHHHIMVHPTAANANNCIVRSNTTLIPSQYNGFNNLSRYHGLSSDQTNTFAKSLVHYSKSPKSQLCSNYKNNNNHGISPTLVLDSSRGELVNASRIMRPKEILDAKAIAASKIHSEAERRRRERINSHLATLRTILPTSIKSDKATLLAEVIMELKRLKRKVLDVYQYDKDNMTMPTENNELKVETDRSSTKDRLTLRASLCCDDRPNLMREIKCSLDKLQLQTLKVDISTLGGRIKNVFILALKEDEKVINGEQDARILIKQVEEALKLVIELRPKRLLGEVGLLQYKHTKRR